MHIWLMYLAAGLLAFGSSWLVIRFANNRVDMLRPIPDIMDDGYRSAQALIADNDVPEIVIDFISDFSHHTYRPRLARRFTYHLMTGRIRKGAGVKTENARKFSEALDKLSDVQKKNFATYIASGFVVSASSDFWISKIHMISLAIFMTASGRQGDKSISVERAKTAAIDLSGSFRGCVPA